MEVTFRTYCGLAGDFQELLFAETDTGISVHRLYNRAYFKNFNQKRAKRKLLKEIKNLTPITIYEGNLNKNARYEE